MLAVSPAVAGRKYLIPSSPPSPLSLPPLLPVIFRLPIALTPRKPLEDSPRPPRHLRTNFFASIPPVSRAPEVQRATSPGAPGRPRSAAAERRGQTPQGCRWPVPGQPLPPSACAQPRLPGIWRWGLFKGIVQRLVQRLPPSGSGSLGCAPLPTLSRGRTEKQKSAGGGG